MKLDPETERLVSATLLRLRLHSPFFATLALFAQFRAAPDQDDLPAATDGREILINPALLRALTPGQQVATLLHTILHAALLHAQRRGTRDRVVWTMAADIVVNGMIARVEGCELPANSPRAPELEQFSVEEVYELLQFSPERQPPRPGLDLFDLTITGTPGERIAQGESPGGSIASSQPAALEAHWRNAFQQANLVAEMVSPANVLAGSRREMGQIEAGQLDWRTHLWRYLVQTPTDFQDYDRRFIGQRIYLETLAGEAVNIFVAVDTSGSVNDQQVRMLVSEVQQILRTYPHLVATLYYADDQVYGPYQLTATGEIPAPVGGGGTDFQPFFVAVAAERNPHAATVCIYLTDGYGLFPKEPPDLPTLWVVTPGGRDLNSFPFGEAVRLMR